MSKLILCIDNSRTYVLLYWSTATCMEGSSEGYKEEHLSGIRENVNTEEYRDAVRLLQGFAEADMSHVDTLSELAEATRGVGQALRAVIISHPDGTHTTGKTTRWVSEDGMRSDVTRQEAEYTLDKAVGKNHVWLSVRKEDPDQEVVEVSVRPSETLREPESVEQGVKSIFNSGYGVHLFADRPLSISDDPLMNYKVDAYETPPGATRRAYYQPLLQPANSLVQKEYAQVLQACVKDVLSIKPAAPTAIPPAFAKAFSKQPS